MNICDRRALRSCAALLLISSAARAAVPLEAAAAAEAARAVPAIGALAGISAPALSAAVPAPLAAPAVDRLPLGLPAPTPLAVHLDALRALPGAVAVSAEPAPFDVTQIRVVFDSLDSLRAGRDAYADRIEYESRLVAGRERMSAALGLPKDAPLDDLLDGYARMLSRMDGVRRVLYGVYAHGDAYFDLAANTREQALVPIERDRHPFQLGAQPVLRDAPRHAVQFEVEEKARKAHIASLENAYAERLSAIPGVVAVERHARFSDFGDPPIVEFVPVFESHEALGRARDRGRLPTSFPTIDEYLWDVGWYSVRPRVR